MRADTNDIATEQNTTALLDFQAAAQLLYGRAELVSFFQFGLGVVVPIMFAVGNVLLPKLDLVGPIDIQSFAGWGALYGLSMLFFDEFVLDSLQEKWKKSAATAREAFDTRLFRLKWRTTKVGPEPEAFDVDRWARRWYRQERGLAAIRNWYAPIVRCLPLGVARVVCQRSNLSWDSKLRERYAILLAGFAVTLLGLTIIVAKVFGLDMNAFLIATATLLPAFRWSLRQLKKHLTSSGVLETLCHRARELENDLVAGRLSENEAEEQTREVQDGIYDHRRAAPIGVSWVYNLLRGEFETGMQSSAEKTVRIYRETHDLAPCDADA